MDTRAARVTLSAVIAVAALSICQVSGDIQCHNTTCTDGSECASKFDSNSFASCRVCATIIKRSEGATTTVERRCTISTERFIIGCKITVAGQDTVEVCTCEDEQCNGAYTEVYNISNALRCVQCHYQDENGKGTTTCNENPTDPTLAVTCPSASHCATEYDYYSTTRSANRFCARWNKSVGCYKENTGLRTAEVCFCSGQLCNNAPASSGSATSATAAGTSAPPSSKPSADSAASGSSTAPAGELPKPTGRPSTGGAAWRFSPDWRAAALSIILTATHLLKSKLDLFKFSTSL